jgi:hypothetical protein
MVGCVESIVDGSFRVEGVCIVEVGVAELGTLDVEGWSLGFTMASTLLRHVSVRVRVVGGIGVDVGVMVLLDGKGGRIVVMGWVGGPNAGMEHAESIVR